MRSRRIFTGLTFVLAGAMLASACSGKVAPAKGQIMVVLQSDMAVPKDISRAQVLITVQGRVVHDKLYVANVSGELRLPGTIAVVAGEKEAETVVVQVVGIDDGGNALTFNKAITTVPRSRIATLRLPMQWLCTGQVRAFNSDGQSFFASSCAPANGEERACVAGSCTSITLDEATLPTFSAPEVFGGGEYPNDPSGQCFDVQGCFKPGVDLALDLDPESQTYCQAAINVPANAEVNFAVKTGPNGAGVCDDDPKAPCFVVLDRSETFGWTALESGEGPGTTVVQFPYAVCERLTDDPTLRLTATAACKAKTEQTPLCGPWSTASAPQVPNPDLVLMTPSAGGGEGGAGGMSGIDTGTGGEVSSSGGEGGAASSGGGSVINECPAQAPPPTTSPVIANFDSAQAEPGIDLVDARQGFAFSVGYGTCSQGSLSKVNGGADGSARYLHFQGQGACSMTGGNATTLVVPLNATGFASTEVSVPPDTMCPYPATGYTGISFWAKTTSANTLNVSVLTPSTVSQADVVPGGTCVSNCAPRAVNVALNAAWAEYQVLFAPLEVNPDQVLGIQIQPTAKNENMFDIDQIAFTGGGAD